jgi:hypothetical protein
MTTEEELAEMRALVISSMLSQRCLNGDRWQGDDVPVTHDFAGRLLFQCEILPMDLDRIPSRRTKTE